MHENLKLFLSAHIVKGDVATIIYNGELGLLGRTLDGATAEMRYDTHNKEIKFDTIGMQLFGDSLTLMIPHFVLNEKLGEKDYDNIQDITSEYRNIISEYLKSGLISDRRGSTLFKVLDVFGVGIYKGLVCYFKLKDKPLDVINSIKKTNTLDVGGKMMDILVSDVKDIQRYENIMLLFKEVSDGYYDVRKHSLVEKQQGAYIQQEYVMGKDIYVEINNITKEIVRVEQEDTKFEGYRTNAGWMVKTPEGEEINTKDFVPYKIEEDGEILKMRLYGAYTHVLRDLLEFKPLTWQYKFLINFRRLNFVAGSRRSGKSFLSAYIILRELWKMPNSIRHISRQVRGLYIAPTEDKFKEVIDYIKKSSEKIRILKVIDFNKKENRLYLYNEKVGRNQKTQITVATCDMSSAKGYEPGRGRAADMVLIDEAAFVDENVWLNILPILENEKAGFFAVSTIDWTTQRNWFYEQLIEAEKGIDKEMYGMRVTIDDIDDILVDEGMRRRMKAALKHDQPRYYAELYASLPEIGNVFNTEGFFILNKEFLGGEKIGGYVIGYDPAKRSDIGAVVVGELKVSGAGKSYCQLIEEYQLKGEYQDQKGVLASIKQKYQIQANGGPVIVVIDGTQVGDVVAEMFGDIIDYKVWYTSKGSRPSVDAYGAWKISKTHLVHLSQILIEKGIMKAYVGLKNLMDEMKNFKIFKTSSGGTKYEADVGHDDHVNAMMLIGFFLGYIEGRVYEFGLEGQNITPIGIDPKSNLYEGTSRRALKEEEIKAMFGMGFGV